MSDRISKWTGGLLIGVGAVAVAGGIALAVYCVRRNTSVTTTETTVEPSKMDTLQPVQEEVTVAVRVDTYTSAVNSEHLGHFQTQETDSIDFGGEVITYEEIYGDVQNCLKPLFDNTALYDAYLKYIQVPTKAIERLKSLSEYLKRYEGTLTTNQVAPTTPLSDIDSIVGAMSPGLEEKLQEVKALLPLTVALAEYPAHIVRKALTLAPVKRNTLIDLIRSTPNGVSKHVYTNQGPFDDPDLQPIMTRMGFSIPSYQDIKNLTYASGQDDKLTTGLFLLLGTAGPSN